MLIENIKLEVHIVLSASISTVDRIFLNDPRNIFASRAGQWFTCIIDRVEHQLIHAVACVAHRRISQETLEPSLVLLIECGFHLVVACAC